MNKNKKAFDILLREMDETKQERDRLVNQMQFTNDALLLEHLMFSLRATEAKWRYLWKLSSHFLEMGIETNRVQAIKRGWSRDLP